MYRKVDVFIVGQSAMACQMVCVDGTMTLKAITRKAVLLNEFAPVVQISRPCILPDEQKPGSHVLDQRSQEQRQPERPLAKTIRK